MRELVRPRPVDVGMFLLAALLVAAIAGGTFYVKDLQAERSQLSARVGALERRPAQRVTVSPSPVARPTQSSEAPDSGPPSGPSAGSSGSLAAAAPGGRQSAARSPRQPSTGGSSQSPSTPRPPAAAPPSESAEDNCAARLLALCVRASLLSGD